MLQLLDQDFGVREMSYCLLKNQSKRTTIWCSKSSREFDSSGKISDDEVLFTTYLL